MFYNPAFSTFFTACSECPDYDTNSVDFRDHIETCFGVLRRELDHREDDIFKFLLECAEQLPHKIPLYGTLVGLLNLENDGFVKKVVETIHTRLQEALDCGNCSTIRILMRFLTVLMCCKVVQPSALLVVFETLLSSVATIVDEEKRNPSWQACADFYVTCILSCLPWGGSELIEQVPEEIERVIVGIEAYLSIRRHCSDIGVSAFEDSDSTHKVHSEKDFLEDLWGRIQDLSNNGWKLDSVPRPHLQFEAQLVAGKSHDFGPINCPELPDAPVTLSGIAFGRQKHDAELKYPQRICRLYIFPANKTESAGALQSCIGTKQPVNAWAGKGSANTSLALVGDYRRAAGRGWNQSSSKEYVNYYDQPAVIPPPLEKGWQWRSNPFQVEKAGNVLALNPADATDDKEEENYDDESDAYPSVDIYDSDESEKSHETLKKSSLLKAPKHDLKDKTQLLKLIQNFPEGIAVADLQDAYLSVDHDLKALKATGKIWLLSNFDSAEDIAYPYDDMGIKVDDDMKKLLRGIELSRDMIDIEKYLQKNGMKPATNTAQRRAQAQMALQVSLDKFKKQQEMCQKTLSSIKASSNSTPRVTPYNPANAKSAAPVVKFSSDIERLQQINTIRCSSAAAQTKRVIDLLVQSFPCYHHFLFNGIQYSSIIHVGIDTQMDLRPAT
ncbi:hypothetical protein POM88_023161 [Heracleum sosnowskyi]|uniref:MIF4G domain-containing protein n=1 Tax=Heracleum sosnowskyi TaxID=360622 RepID=A0AAD8MU99_9APIA|nr:hypothetical protein POM88_023161 [Heracleum sosnowskyi]